MNKCLSIKYCNFKTIYKTRYRKKNRFEKSIVVKKLFSQENFL